MPIFLMEVHGTHEIEPALFSSVKYKNSEGKIMDIWDLEESILLPDYTYTGNHQRFDSVHPSNKTPRYYVKLLTSGTLTFHSNAIYDACIIGGGGGGGKKSSGSMGIGEGGGGGGRIYNIMNLSAPAGSPISIKIGNGGAVNGNGGNTTWAGYTASGGKAGLTWTGSTTSTPMVGGVGGAAGGAGGSGGGGGGGSRNYSASGGSGGANGAAGSTGGTGTEPQYYKGGVGGSGGGRVIPFNSGSVYPVVPPFSTMAFAGGGGGGGGTNVSGANGSHGGGTGASSTAGTAGTVNTGSGGGGGNYYGAGAGGSGIALFRVGDWSE